MCWCFERSLNRTKGCITKRGSEVVIHVDWMVKVVQVIQPGASARAADTPACGREGIAACGREGIAACGRGMIGAIKSSLSHAIDGS